MEAKAVLQCATSPQDALKLAEKLIGQWPHARPPDAKTYAAALSATLASYPRQVAQECVDPRSGLARSREFLPTVACVVEWCDRRLKEYRDLATVNLERWRAYEKSKLPPPEFSEEHCKMMRDKIAAIPGEFFQRMPGSEGAER